MIFSEEGYNPDGNVQMDGLLQFVSSLSLHGGDFCVKTKFKQLEERLFPLPAFCAATGLNLVFVV